MKDFFSIGELAGYQKISKQTLIFYDKIGLFKPAYTNPETGYRYYSALQLDTLDTIVVMKTIGFSLEEIKAYMANRNFETSRERFRQQIDVIDRQLEALGAIKKRLLQKCATQDEFRRKIRHEPNENVHTEKAVERYIFCQPVAPPYSLADISLATKKCFTLAAAKNVPVFYEVGVSVPRERLFSGRYVEASLAFLSSEYAQHIDELKHLPAGRCVVAYHYGEYLKIDGTYEKIFEYCKKNHLEIISDSYEFCIHDNLTAGDQKEYITKIMFYIK